MINVKVRVVMVVGATASISDSLFAYSGKFSQQRRVYNNAVIYHYISAVMVVLHFMTRRSIYR